MERSPVAESCLFWCTDARWRLSFLFAESGLFILAANRGRTGVSTWEFPGSFCAHGLPFVFGRFLGSLRGGLFWCGPIGIIR